MTITTKPVDLFEARRQLALLEELKGLGDSERDAKRRQEIIDILQKIAGK